MRRGQRWRKQKLSKFFGKIWGQEGSVTVFVSLITAFFLMFSALFIDYARLAEFNRQLEVVTQSGVRSVLSAYDDGLYENYGLFGRGGTPGDQIFRDVVTIGIEGNKNWRKEESVFRLLDGTLTDSHINTAQVLGDRKVFRRQLLQEMKYKAPIDFTIELVNKFAPLSEAMKESSEAVNMLEKLGKLFDSRQKALLKALESQKSAAHQASGLGSLILKNGTSAGTGTVLGIASEYSSYISWIDADSNLEEGQLPQYTLAIYSYVQQSNETTNKLLQLAEQSAQAHITAQASALDALAEAQQLNDQMKAVIAEARSSGNSEYDRLLGYSDHGSASPEASQASANIRDTSQMVEQMLLDENWFSAFKLEIEEQSSAWQPVQEATSHFQQAVNSAVGGSSYIYGSVLSQSADALQAKYSLYQSNYGHTGTVIASREQAIEQLDSSSKERKEQESKAKSLWTKSRNLLGGLKDITGSSEQKQAFKQVDEKFKSSLLFNDKLAGAAEDAESPDEVDSDTTDAKEKAKNSQLVMGSLFSGMGDVLEGTRDTMYISEYAAQRFSHFEPGNMKEYLTGAVLDSSALSQAADLENQELEYILYGFADPMANLAAAYGELFTVRLAVRTMEGLSECKGMGHPLLILAAAVVYGLEKAMEDLISLANDGSAPFSKYVKVDLTYLDYLRLFFLLHGGEVNKLSRMIAVIEQRTDLTLSIVPSGVTGEATASVSVWFLPGLMKLIGRTGLLQGNISGGRYETTKMAGWSY